MPPNSFTKHDTYAKEKTRIPALPALCAKATHSTLFCHCIATGVRAHFAG
jgi:hypothetical protein